MNNFYPFNESQISHNFFNSRKIAIIGNQGAGKTTLAIKLADIVGIDFIDIGNEDLDPVTKKQMMAQDSWIIDGEFDMDEFADIIIFLDFPILLCLLRGIKRAFQNFVKWDFLSLASLLKIAPRISMMISWIIAVLMHPKKKRPVQLQKCNSQPTKQTITFYSPQEVDHFLENLNHYRKNDFGGIGNFLITDSID